MFDYLVVGSGLFGSVFAQQALSNKKSVLVIDKRDHIGGNCYTKKHEGIDVHVYGPHIFHTSDERIWNYINRYSKFNNFVNRPKVNYQNKLYSFPINLFTLYQLWGVDSPASAKIKLDEVKVHCESPRNLEEWILSQVGTEIYEKFIYGYTKKQWMKDPKDLPASIIKRLPIRLTFDDNYYEDSYQGIPEKGYTDIISTMLEGASLELGVDFFENREKYSSIAKKIVYTGKIDQFFDYCHGELEYRTLEFENSVLLGDFQGNAVINYTEENVKWTRITEHKHFQTHLREKSESSLITKEIPAIWHRDAVPYYPIGNEENLNRYRKYEKLKSEQKEILFGGRLAEYKYYDMHQIIASSLHLSKKEFGKNI